MIETVIFVVGLLVIGGILRFICGNGTVYSAEYYQYLRDNKGVSKKVSEFKDNNLYL
jgi:hypothetical protein